MMMDWLVNDELMRKECRVTNLELLNLSETIRFCILFCLIFEFSSLARLFQLHILTLSIRAPDFYGSKS